VAGTAAADAVVVDGSIMRLSYHHYFIIPTLHYK
jgi:hypothetical protein